jgi:sulfur-carrier protein
MAGEVAVTVTLRGVLRQHADGRSEVEVTVPTGASVREVLDRLADDLPAVERRVRDETGALRRHVNVFVDAADLRHLGGLDHRVTGGEQVLLLPAISGG